MSIRAVARNVAIGSLVRRADTWNPARDGTGQTIRYVDLGSLDNSTKQIAGHQTLLAAEAPSRARQLIAAGDILVSTVRPNLNGVARVPDTLDGSTASTGFCVLRPERELDSSYLFQWVKSPAFVEAMVKRATGQSYPAVSDRIIFESQIPLPPLGEQRRIAAILDQADTLRRKRREALLKLAALENSVFEALCGDPVSNTKGWPEGLELGAVADIVSGVTKGRKLEGKVTRTVPYLAVANVQDRFLSVTAVKEIEATEAEIARFRLRRGDLLLTEGGDPDKLGRGALWADELPEAIHQNHVFRVRLRSDLFDPIYLNWLVGSTRGKQYFLRAAKQTTGIASINMGQLKKFPLLMPPIEVQHAFAKAINGIHDQKQSQENHLAHLDALFAVLQHRAFLGEL